MCVVVYAYYGCGHQQLHSSECDYAVSLQLPFFQKVQCPNYQGVSKHPAHFCGLGQFYCKHSPDGPFLEHVHQKALGAKAGIEQLHLQLAHVQKQGLQFTRAADQQGLSEGERRQRPEYQALEHRHRNLMQQKAKLQATVDDAASIVQQACAFSNNQTQQAQQGYGALMQYGQGAVITPQNPQLLPSPAGSSVPVAARPYAPTPTNRPPRPPKQHRNEWPLPDDVVAFLKEHQEKTVRERQQAGRMQPPPLSNKNGGRPGRGVEAPKTRGRKRANDDREDEEEETEIVRRSTRTRNKKVNYAESAGSSIGSREPSPAKSDISGFSPSKKSEASSSPAKSGRSKGQNITDAQSETRRLRATATSLSEKMSDWKRRGSALSTATPTQRRAMPDMKDLLNSSPAQATPLSNTTISPPGGYAPTPGLNSALTVPGEAAGRRAASYNLMGAPNPNVQQARPRSMTQLRPTSHALPSLTSVNPTMITPASSNRYAPHNQPPAANGWSVASGSIANFSGLPFAPGQSLPQQQQVSRSRSLQDSLLAKEAPPLDMRQDSVMSRSDGVPSLDDYHPQSYGNMHRSDSMQSVQSQLPSHPNYDSMRRSFSLAADFDPPAAPIPTPESFEPKKRSLPPSSPMGEPAKRMRLSLPRESIIASHETDWVLGREVDLNSSFKAQAQQLANDETTQQPTLSTTEDVLAPPAPIFDAASVLATQGRDEGNAGDELTEQQRADDEGGDGVDPNGFDWSDIDWGRDFELETAPA